MKKRYKICRNCGVGLWTKYINPCTCPKYESADSDGEHCAHWKPLSRQAAEADQKRGIVVYVASPLRGNIKTNLEYCRNCCAMVISLGAIPIAPHLIYSEYLSDETPSERKLGMAMGKVLLGRCDELWVFGDTISEGMQSEIDEATALGIPVKYVGKKEVAEWSISFLDL